MYRTASSGVHTSRTHRRDSDNNDNNDNHNHKHQVTLYPNVTKKTQLIQQFY
jgi:hypothetical protein